jgi:putative flippase GtrA
MKKNSKFALFIQFIKFGIIGVSNTLVSLLVYYAFLYFDENLYLVGNLVGWVVSVANSFFWNYKFVFKSENHSLSDTAKKVAKTYICYGITFLLSTLLLWAEVEVLHWSQVISPIVNLFITVPLNFFMNKLWAFR